jgi:hypothetical protein
MDSLTKASGVAVSMLVAATASVLLVLPAHPRLRTSRGAGMTPAIMVASATARPLAGQPLTVGGAAHRCLPPAAPSQHCRVSGDSTGGTRAATAGRRRCRHGPLAGQPGRAGAQPGRTGRRGGTAPARTGWARARQCGPAATPPVPREPTVPTAPYRSAVPGQPAVPRWPAAPHRLTVPCQPTAPHRPAAPHRSAGQPANCMTVTPRQPR